MNAIKPCPFCGGAAEEFDDDGASSGEEVILGCSSCSASAIARDWNRRVVS
jgi:hypothetical protein